MPIWLKDRSAELARPDALGRSEIGGEAIALLYLDGPITSDAVNQLKGTGMFKQVKPLAFDITK